MTHGSSRVPRMRLVALLLRALDAEKPNICPAFSTGRCCPCVRACACVQTAGWAVPFGRVRWGRRGGGMKATGRAVGEVTVQTVHLSLRKSHSRCSNCKCYRNRLKTHTHTQDGKILSYASKTLHRPTIHARTHARQTSWLE